MKVVDLQECEWGRWENFPIVGEDLVINHIEMESEIITATNLILELAKSEKNIYSETRREIVNEVISYISISLFETPEREKPTFHNGDYFSMADSSDCEDVYHGIIHLALLTAFYILEMNDSPRKKARARAVVFQTLQEAISVKRNELRLNSVQAHFLTIKASVNALSKSMNSSTIEKKSLAPVGSYLGCYSRESNQKFEINDSSSTAVKAYSRNLNQKYRINNDLSSTTRCSDSYLFSCNSNYSVNEFDKTFTTASLSVGSSIDWDGVFRSGYFCHQIQFEFSSFLNVVGSKLLAISHNIEKKLRRAHTID